MVALQVDPHELRPDHSDEIPVVVCIALDHGRRERLARLLDGVGVLVFARDLETARSMLGRPAGRNGGRNDHPAAARMARIGGLEVDRVRCVARWRGTELPLTARERDLLALFAGDPSRVWTYRDLHAAAWSGRYLDPGPVHAAVKRLRRKLRDCGTRLRVDAVRGVGYRLVGSDPAAEPTP